MTTFLLDTHVLIWWTEGDPRLPARVARAVQRAANSGDAIVSDISSWEVALLVERGQLRFRIPLREWLEAAMAPPLVQRIGITPAIAAETTHLPDWFHRDPADRILVATARVFGARMVTLDDRILQSGVVPTVGPRQ